MQDKIRKWDEVHGVIETEIGLLECELVEAAGVSPSISRNYLRIIEDAVEQNDNSFDGIINNEPKQKEEEQKSLLSKSFTNMLRLRISQSLHQQRWQ